MAIPIPLGVTPASLPHFLRSWAGSLPWIEWYASETPEATPLITAKLLGVFQEPTEIIIPKGSKSLQIDDFEDLYPKQIEAIIQAIRDNRLIRQVSFNGNFKAQLLPYMDNDAFSDLITEIHSIRDITIEINTPIGYVRRAAIFDYSEATRYQQAIALPINLATLKQQAKLGALSTFAFVEDDDWMPFPKNYLFLLSCLADVAVFIKRLK